MKIMIIRTQNDLKMRLINAFHKLDECVYPRIHVLFSFFLISFHFPRNLKGMFLNVTSY